MMVMHHSVHHLLVVKHRRVVQLCMLEGSVITFLLHDNFFTFLYLLTLLCAPILEPDFHLQRKACYYVIERLNTLQLCQVYYGMQIRIIITQKYSTFS